ncbi:MAG: endonuclease/exonuclease/phosphatase family protein [Pirellulales bacterium]
MFRLLIKLFPLLAVVGTYFFLQKYEINGLGGIGVAERKETPTAVGPVVPVRPGDKLRIASWNIQVFGESKAGDAKSIEVIAQTIRQFDVVAVQEIRASSPDFLDRFMRLVNSGGLQYGYVVGPRLGRSDSKEQYAFIFDQSRVEIDRSPSGTYTVRDPDDLLHREPLVAGFRARNAPPNEAFTFSLVNIHTDPDEVDAELNALDDVFRAVRNDGRGEDDVILLGDLNTDEGHLGQLGQVPYIDCAIRGTPTNTRRDKTYDNILFDRNATTEYLGVPGVLDLVRQFNLTQDQALKVSDHLPIWAEFSVYEGGRPGSVAGLPPAAAR